jgi:hypothetical protein
MVPLTKLSAFLLLDDARQWRARAEEWRVVADGMRDDTCKHRAYRIADDYDRMANHAEKRPAAPRSYT